MISDRRSLPTAGTGDPRLFDPVVCLPHDGRGGDARIWGLAGLAVVAVGASADVVRAVGVGPYSFAAFAAFAVFASKAAGAGGASGGVASGGAISPGATSAAPRVSIDVGSAPGFSPRFGSARTVDGFPGVLSPGL